MEAALPAWFEITSFVVILAILAADLTLAFKRPHIPSTSERKRKIPSTPSVGFGCGQPSPLGSRPRKKAPNPNQEKCSKLPSARQIPQ